VNSLDFSIEQLEKKMHHLPPLMLFRTFFRESEPPFFKTLSANIDRVLEIIPGGSLKRVSVLHSLQNNPEVWKRPGMEEAVFAFLRDPDGPNATALLKDILMKVDLNEVEA
jgi:hypothetical protein